MKEIYCNKTNTLVVKENETINGDIQLFFCDVYKHDTQVFKTKTYSIKSRKLADKKINQWLEGVMA